MCIRDRAVPAWLDVKVRSPPARVSELASPTPATMPCSVEAFAGARSPDDATASTTLRPGAAPRGSSVMSRSPCMVATASAAVLAPATVPLTCVDDAALDEGADVRPSPEVLAVRAPSEVAEPASAADPALVRLPAPVAWLVDAAPASRWAAGAIAVDPVGSAAATACSTPFTRWSMPLT